MTLYELRQYTLHPGGFPVLADLFDRVFTDGLEACGMRVDGQFADLDDPDRFVWIRSFPDLDSRTDALTAFYVDSDTWRDNRAAANATMIDSDDVLLLQPAPGWGDLRDSRGSELITATVWLLPSPPTTPCAPAPQRSPTASRWACWRPTPGRTASRACRSARARTRSS
ncbi:NIPSNAP family protein [Actinokineospora soli]|uniref:NIPSNAP family protein n=1 Tax=Actinokineospora soli TaxID=1048753 RepID=A0ABW2TQ69_9PSEU